MFRLIVFAVLKVYLHSVYTTVHFIQTNPQTYVIELLISTDQWPRQQQILILTKASQHWKSQHMREKYLNKI